MQFDAFPAATQWLGRQKRKKYPRGPATRKIKQTRRNLIIITIFPQVHSRRGSNELHPRATPNICVPVCSRCILRIFVQQGCVHPLSKENFRNTGRSARTYNPLPRTYNTRLHTIVKGFEVVASCTRTQQLGVHTIV